MFSPGSSASRPSFSISLSLDRPSSSRGRPDPTPAPPPRRSMAKANIIDIPRANAPNDTGFTTRGGKKHHPFDPEVAPYPLNYDSKIVDLDVLDQVFLMQSRDNRVTWVDYKGNPPKRSLDLGCGTGGKLVVTSCFTKSDHPIVSTAWILDAAKQWKDCHFVGFDLMRVQPKLHLLPGLANRIRWVHGNFLSGRLPFEDNSFDHVHMYRIAWGVAEVHWDGLFEEIARILRPGGAIEVGEEDILFPRLPRSYTIKANQPRPSAPYPRPSLTLSPPPSPVDEPDMQTHAHALLESLFFGVFESRMINLRPTSIIPHHFNIHFRHVLTTPKVEFPFPPPPVSRQQLRHVASDCTARPTRRPSHGSTSSLSSASSESFHAQQQTPPTTNSSVSSLCSSESNAKSKLCAPPSLPRKSSQMFGTFVETNSSDVAFLPPVPAELNDRSLALHLNTAYQRILACKEAMWDELVRRVLTRRRGGPDLLHGLGWDDELDDDDADSSDSGHGGGHLRWSEARELERAHARFEELLARFERDMRYRTALADALEAAMGWVKPAAEPLGKHERARQAELERAIADAARAEPEDVERAQCSRSFKGFVGFKEGKR